MKWLYILLNLGTLSIPFLCSFHPKLNFIRHQRLFWFSTTIIAVFFLIWDVVFTSVGIWGFNPEYYLGVTFFKMPVEEWMFFFCIPYSSLYIYYSLECLFPDLVISETVTKTLLGILSATAFLLICTHYAGAYTFVNYSVFLGALVLGGRFGLFYLRRFFIAFIIILIPFFLVNGVLTGTGIDSSVVWYNDFENLGIRLGTIPVEDISYAFSMLYLNLLLFEYLKQKYGVK